MTDSELRAWLRPFVEGPTFASALPAGYDLINFVRKTLTGWKPIEPDEWPYAVYHGALEPRNWRNCLVSAGLVSPLAVYRIRSGALSPSGGRRIRHYGGFPERADIIEFLGSER